MAIALGSKPKYMKFLFEKFIAPRATGRYAELCSEVVGGRSLRL